MIDKPTSDISWATDNIVDPIYGVNKLEPEVDVKNEGLKGDQDFLRVWYNWQMNEMVKYIQWLEQEVEALKQEVGI